MSPARRTGDGGGGASGDPAGPPLPVLVPVLILLLGVAAPLLLADGAPPRALAAWVALVLAAAAVLTWREGRRRTARRESVESLRRLHQAHKLEAVGRLAGGLAHDVNNYLAVIRTHCEAVLAQDLPRERVEEKMHTVVRAVLRASSLVERLLAFGRRQPGRPEPVDLNQVVEAHLGVMGGGEGAQVTARLAPDLWPVEIDLSQVEQVVANLVVNARDASPPGGPVEITTRNRPAAEGAGGGAGGDHGGEVVLEVADRGAGIPPELLERIFEPFFTTREGRGATGLGLSTVYGIVRQAGGRVEVESTPGAGSTFRVVLPRTLRPPAPPPADRDLLEGTESVLLVDDNRELAAAVASYLEELGYRVTSLGGAAPALGAAAAARERGEPFDLVITDVQLGGRSGLDRVSPAGSGAAPLTGPELVERLRADAPVKALFMTGYTERIVLRAVDRRDEAYFVKKPFSMEGLVRMVRELLDADLEIEVP